MPIGIHIFGKAAGRCIQVKVPAQSASTAELHASSQEVVLSVAQPAPSTDGIGTINCDKCCCRIVSANQQ